MQGEGRKGYSAKRSSDPPGSLPRSQSSGTGPNVSCGYCCPLWGGGQYLRKICFIEPQGVNGHRRHVPGAPISSTPREGQAKFRDGPCGDCRRILWVPGPWGQYSGKICFIDKARVQD